jgi:hypothetical protein
MEGDTSMAVVTILGPDGAAVDTSQVQAWDGESGSLTPGNYIFAITEAVQEASARKGTPQLKLTLEVINGDTEVHNGQTAWHNLNLKGDNERSARAAAGRMVNFMQAVGVEPGFDDQDLIGKMFMAEVKLQEYEDTDGLGNKIPKTRTQICKEQPAPGATPAAAPPAAAPVARPAPAAAPPARAAAPALPPGPRVATSLPVAGQRMPIPMPKKK